MNIYELRQSIYVTIYYSLANGGHILYIRNNRTDRIYLTHDQLFSELKAIGSVDDVDNWGESVPLPLSQWDALNIAIRHELRKEQLKEIENSDIGNSINNLLNK